MRDNTLERLMTITNNYLRSYSSALTIDVEDAVSQAMRNYFDTNMKPTERVLQNTMKLLDLFSEFKVLGTFFILGEVAETFPGLIKEIANRGHELGIHGYSHARYYTLSKKKAREEVVKTKHIVEDISGQIVIGHRAPEFSINRESQWVLEILLEAGIKYDSSIFPVNSGRYGWPGFNKNICWHELEGGKKIIEVPLSVVNYLGMNFPTCGGVYTRILPYTLINKSFKKILKERPVCVYLHPYDIDPPPFQKFYMDKVRKASFIDKAHFKLYWLNRRTVIHKLTNLLNEYSFNTLRNVINDNLKTDL